MTKKMVKMAIFLHFFKKIMNIYFESGKNLVIINYQLNKGDKWK